MDLSDFGLSPFGLYEVLQSKGVQYLHHANTITTSLTFIEQRALLSRYYIESNELVQTSQKSDQEDKDFDVWDHVFFDGADLHVRYRRANVYGPVLFRVKLSLLKSHIVKHIFVTKTNPMYWRRSMQLSERYYSRLEDVDNEYLTGKVLDSYIMFTLRGPNNAVKLNKYLDSIVLDSPNIIIGMKTGGTKQLLAYSEGKIKEALQENRLSHIPVIIRSCPIHCGCRFNYSYLSRFDLAQLKNKYGDLRSELLTKNL